MDQPQKHFDTWKKLGVNNPPLNLDRASSELAVQTSLMVPNRRQALRCAGDGGKDGGSCFAFFFKDQNPDVLPLFKKAVLSAHLPIFLEK